MNSLEAYQAATPEQRTSIDALFVQIDKQMALKRLDRERRQVQVAFEGDEKRKEDRREGGNR